jgi:hypothetical protein
LFARCTASCVFTVNLSQRIAMLLFPYLNLVILGEAKDLCIFADAGKMHRSFAPLRMTIHSNFHSEL